MAIHNTFRPLGDDTSCLTCKECEIPNVVCQSIVSVRYAWFIFYFTHTKYFHYH
jgi:hypothetical protein